MGATLNYLNLGNQYDVKSSQVIFDLTKNLLTREDKLLDLSIGTGKHILPLKNRGIEIYGYDTDKFLIDICKTRNLVSNIHFGKKTKDLPYDNHHFDHVISANGMRRTFMLEKTFEEVNRVLKKNGTFSFTIEIFEGSTKAKKIEGSLAKRYLHNYNYLQEVIKNYGFEPVHKVFFKTEQQFFSSCYQAYVLKKS